MGTELLWCKGSTELFKVPGAQINHSVTNVVLDHSDQMNLLFLLQRPHCQLELGHHHNFSYLTIACNYPNYFCILKRVLFD